MTKMIKKIAAVGAAVMMMASISAMGASAETITKSIGGYSTQCGAYTSGNGLFVSTAVSNNSITVSVSGSATYKYNGVSTSTGNGNGGRGATTATLSKRDGATWTALTTTHWVNSSSKTVDDDDWKKVGVI